MSDQREIYEQDAKRYEKLISKEDCDGNILSALMEIYPFEGANVVELGAGTGRLTRLLAPLTNTIWGLDISAHMLGVGATLLEADGAKDWGLAVADHRDLPLAADIADVAISGWSLCYLAVWGGEEWEAAVEKALTEMERVLQRKGTIILLETLGTGFESPVEPEKLSRYYEYLEHKGFSRKWIRTDMVFESLEEAGELIGFFFGEELAMKVKENGWIRVPECTGIWWRSVG